MGNQDEADCILQETFLKVLESLPKFKGDSQLSTWIYRIATNQALMRLRSKKRRYVSIPIENDYEVEDYASLNQSFAANPLSELLNTELSEKMNAAIELLSPKYKSVFILKDIEGLSLKEISEILKISIPAVKSNLHRARLFLREKLSEFIDDRKE
jgi:RNA polymerase sigma-70 factor (ECF subfamily)